MLHYFRLNSLESETSNLERTLVIKSIETHDRTTHLTKEYRCKDSRNIKEKQTKKKKCSEIEMSLQIEGSLNPTGSRQKWAKRRANSILKWINLELSQMPARANRIRVTSKNTMSSSEAPRVNTVAVVFWEGGRVGGGRRVAGLGVGAIHELPSSFLIVPNWQIHS